MTQATCISVKIILMRPSVKSDLQHHLAHRPSSKGGGMNDELKWTINSINPLFCIPCFLSILHTHTCTHSLTHTHTHTVINTEASLPNRTWSWCCGAGILYEQKTLSSLTRSSCQLEKGPQMKIIISCRTGQTLLHSGSTKQPSF